MKLNHRHYILVLLSIAALISSILCYVFFYRETTLRATSYLNTLKQAELEKTSVDYEQKIINTFNKYDEDRKKIGSYIVKEDELVPFIERIEKIGVDTHTKLELSSISNGDNRVRAKVTAEGTWTNVMTALIMIENLPISLSVNNIRLDTDLNTADKTTTNKEWRLALDLEALTTK